MHRQTWRRRSGLFALAAALVLATAAPASPAIGQEDSPAVVYDRQLIYDATQTGPILTYFYVQNGQRYPADPSKFDVDTMVSGVEPEELNAIPLGPRLGTNLAPLPGGVATMPTPQGTWLRGPEAADSPIFDGTIDAPDPGASHPVDQTLTVKGWVLDLTAEAPPFWNNCQNDTGIDQVDVYLGLKDAGGKLLGTASLDQPRTDLSSVYNVCTWQNAGYTLDVPANTLPVGTDPITVYAHAPNKGWWYRQVTTTITGGAASTSSGTTSASGVVNASGNPVVIIDEPKEGASVPNNNAITISGAAFDRNAPSGQGSGVDSVTIYLGGDQVNGQLLGTAQLGLPSTSAGAYGAPDASASGWSLTEPASKFHTMPYTVWVYAHSSISGQTTSAQVNFTVYTPTQ